jgi:hypothetical protein
VQLRDRNLVGADSLTDLAVVTKLEPLGREGFLPAAKTLGIGSCQFGPRKEPRGLKDRAKGGADGAFDAVIDIGFHLLFHHREHRG